ncbi:MAG: glutaminyl-peptide cyclotransferase [Gemmatimonadaceae bacterium]|nr:glutaminyl-peptide cyclotransferase [Gemmatimonadaceae bacterium]
MPILSSLRRSRTAAGLILLATLGLVGTAGAFGACSDGTKAAAARDSADSAIATPAARTPTYTYEVVASYPHDTKAFTEGLLWHDGKLFESTGVEGTSWIREVELTSGKVVRQFDLERPHFGEGIVILGNTLFQLTYKSGKAFTYDWKTFTRQATFGYDGEGWALTTDGKELIMSNGTPSVVFRDPRTFVVTKTITVSDHGTPVTQVNELEWVKGELWANIWQSDQIARIDPATGNVVGWIDLGGILPSLDRTGSEDVLNGIAYDAEKDRIFVTGKYWPKLFEIKVKQRS